MPPLARISRRRAAWRIFWIAVALAHARATIGVWGGLGHASTADADWGRLVLLSAGNLFFLLEIIFAPCLRLISDRRTMIALLLIVALLHAGVVQHAIPAFDSTRDLQLWVCVAGIGGLLIQRYALLLRRAS